MAVDKAALLAPRFAEEDVEIPGVGSVRIRSLSRAEALEVRGTELPYAEMERKLLAMTLVDPVLTEDEVGAWQAASPAMELEPVARAAARLCGMEVTAPKEAVKRFRE